MISKVSIGNIVIGTYASGYLIKRLSGFDFPDVRVGVIDRGNYHGARFSNAYYGRRVMSIEGEIVATDKGDFETKRRAMQKALDLSVGLKQLNINTKSGLLLKADVVVNSKFEAEYEAGKMIRCDFRIELVSPFPFLESQTNNERDILILNSGGGEIPMEIPFSLALGATVIEPIDNAGNGNAFPNVRIYGTIENPSLINQTTGKTLSITYDMTLDTDYIDLDFYNRTAILNGTTNVMQYISGDWWELIPGENSIKLTGASAGGAAKAEFSWRDSYLGV